MSESIKSHGEHGHEKLDLAAESRKNLERIHEKAEKSKETTKEHVEQLQSKVESHAISGKEFSHGESESTAHGYQHVNQKELKAESYKKTMKHVRKQLAKPERAFSKVIHNKKIETVSEAGSKTIARPSGILGGGICAFAGSAFLFYMAKHYGFEYSFSTFILLFVGGFFVGMFCEMLLKFILKKT